MTDDMVNLERVEHGKRKLVDPKQPSAAMAHILGTGASRWREDPDLPVIHYDHMGTSPTPDAFDLYSFPSRSELRAFLAEQGLDAEVEEAPLPDHVREVLMEQPEARRPNWE